MLPEFAFYLSWLVAHKVNRLQFVLLCPSRKLDKCTNSQHTERYQTMVRYAHAFGIELHADIALAIKQQHAMHMITARHLPDQLAEIRSVVDWALGTVGFDGMATEAGTSEFTKTKCETSLAWYNELGQYIEQKYPRKKSFIKLHVSKVLSHFAYLFFSHRFENCIPRAKCVLNTHHQSRHWTARSISTSFRSMPMSQWECSPTLSKVPKAQIFHSFSDIIFLFAIKKFLEVLSER